MGHDIVEQIQAFFRELAETPFDLDMRVTGFYLLCAIVLASLIWLVTGRQKSLLAFLFPKEVFTHRSNLLDIKLYFTNRLVGFFGVTGALLFTPLVAYYVLELLIAARHGAWVAPPESWPRVALATLIIVMATDFCKYWAHRIHHEWDTLWPFHAVHHSAEVLTPVTVSRAHPVEAAVRNLIISVLVGVIQAVVVFGLVGSVSMLTIGGANALYFLFNAAGSNLRHSHIWLSYGRVLEHIVISPAQHQIHHSMDKKHFNKNYGSMFALWDWMFGTLYIPPAKEELRFGVADEHGRPLGQPHPTLRAALINPFLESGAAFRRRFARARDTSAAPLDDTRTDP